jgi:2-polyprenyl-3-methyl-5-hydroxy-6-metoxy-1,4-benzoquinol methylase
VTSQRYEDYWAAESPAVVRDPLTPRRRSFLWDRAGRDGGRRLLDCGAGDGGLVATALERGFDATGIEISASAIARSRGCHPAVDIRRHSVEDLPWPVEPGSQDVVVAFEVIEHLLEPRALLRGSHAALVPEGSLFLSTPYHGRLKNVAIAAFGFEKHFAVDGEHVRFFTDRALRGLLDECGFEVVEAAHVGRRFPVWANTVVWARKRP